MMKTTYRAINTINCKGKRYAPGEVIEPCEQITEESLKQWAKKGLVSVNDTLTSPVVATPDAQTEIVPGRSRASRGKKAQEAQDEASEDEE